MHHYLIYILPYKVMKKDHFMKCEKSYKQINIDLEIPCRFSVNVLKVIIVLRYTPYLICILYSKHFALLNNMILQCTKFND